MCTGLVKNETGEKGAETALRGFSMRQDGLGNGVVRSPLGRGNGRGLYSRRWGGHCREIPVVSTRRWSRQRVGQTAPFGDKRLLTPGGLADGIFAGIRPHL